MQLDEPSAKHEMRISNYSLTIGIIVAVIVSMACDNLSDCDKVRNGNFYYYSKSTREKIIINRKDSLQIEFGQDTRDQITSKIVWKGDCKFDLFINALSDTKLIGDDSIIANTPAHVEIIAITDSFYVCNVEFNVFDTSFRRRDTMHFAQ